ncbi:methyltransferase [Halomonas daqiaonensis]|uniref:Methyltransferase domain-containing protein n=1 Tax=Halomonas daqiaonensis TaxID=650850 RepID=A0A1H7VH52_9GAMM|nr:methyltransferase [Halomonas daqiaonensis]SEM08572.1 Methyltransferase domain-containing protein [Halomonas daqiaonensis]
MSESPSHDVDRFARLTELLAEWQPLWRPMPFQHRRLPWAQAYPELAESLRALDDDECLRLQADPFTDCPLAEWLPVAELAALVELPELAAEGPDLPAQWAEQVGGRKWQQIEAFVPRMAAQPGTSLLEWCAGKGHLARTLSRHLDREVAGLEWQAALCHDGQALAERQGTQVRLAQQDVLAPGAARWLTADTQVAALHACGDLHGRLIELAAEQGSAVTLAPCCYHRTARTHYHPFSQCGRELAAAHGFSLSREDLAMAVQETVTAPRHVRRHRERANVWRLGFDALQRQVRGLDAYLPVPSLAYGRMPDSFEEFCRWAAERKGLVLPADVDWHAFEQEGQRRQAEVTRLELVRHLFRRPLEVWLVLDRQRRLEAAGFRVELGTFCDRELTPRNLMLRASR